MRRRAAAVFGLVGSLLCFAACALDLGDTPFACTDGVTCPEGFKCEATVCVSPGATPDVARPMRVTYINSAEMYWFASPNGGATLLVNDGFTPGGKGIFEIHVEDSGRTSAPVKRLEFGGEFPTSSAIVELDEDHYGVLTLSFPNVEQVESVVEFRSLKRESGSTESELLWSEEIPYLGGYEPPYISAVAGDGHVWTALTDPSLGGRAIVEQHSLTGTLEDSIEVPLPTGVLPLSGDCLLWRTDSGKLLLRSGLDDVHVLSIDLAGDTFTELDQQEGLPVWAFDDSIVYLEQGDDSAKLVTRDWAGTSSDETPSFGFQGGIELYTGVPAGPGLALVAPLSDEASFATLDVSSIDGSGALKSVASFARPPDDEVYAARALRSGGRTFAAWTTFHGVQMDLWIGVEGAK